MCYKKVMKIDADPKFDRFCNQIIDEMTAEELRAALRIMARLYAKALETRYDARF